jgi:hypothetical protein
MPAHTKRFIALHAELNAATGLDLKLGESHHRLSLGVDDRFGRSPASIRATITTYGHQIVHLRSGAEAAALLAWDRDGGIGCPFTAIYSAPRAAGLSVACPA